MFDGPGQFETMDDHPEEYIAIRPCVFNGIHDAILNRETRSHRDVCGNSFRRDAFIPLLLPLCLPIGGLLLLSAGIAYPIAIMSSPQKNHSLTSRRTRRSPTSIWLRRSAPHSFSCSLCTLRPTRSATFMDSLAVLRAPCSVLRAPCSVLPAYAWAVAAWKRFDRGAIDDTNLRRATCRKAGAS